MKQLEKNNVLDIATQLITTNGMTTSLEVKTELRNEGFYATQKQVSEFLNELYLDNLLSYQVQNFITLHREYYMPQSAFVQSLNQANSKFELSNLKARKIIELVKNVASVDITINLKNKAQIVRKAKKLLATYDQTIIDNAIKNL